MSPPSPQHQLTIVPKPDRIARLRASARGYPVPWFVAWMQDGQECQPGTGEPDFRIIGRGRMNAAIRQKLCWVCGEPLGRFLCFPLGPMCAITRTISEPPSHQECARYAAQVCPFLVLPHMQRQAHNIPDHIPAAGLPIARNPGVLCLWTTRDYRIVRASIGFDGVLFQVGEPVEVSWWREARPATRSEVESSIASGLPILEASCERDHDPVDSRRVLRAAVLDARRYLPNETHFIREAV